MGWLQSIELYFKLNYFCCSADVVYAISNWLFQHFQEVSTPLVLVVSHVHDMTLYQVQALGATHKSHPPGRGWVYCGLKIVATGATRQGPTLTRDWGLPTMYVVPIGAVFLPNPTRAYGMQSTQSSAASFKSNYPTPHAELAFVYRELPIRLVRLCSKLDQPGDVTLIPLAHGLVLGLELGVFLVLRIVLGLEPRSVLL